MVSLIIWPYGGNQVYFASSATNWELKQMKKCETCKDYFCLFIKLQRGIYQYKFIVDGKWCYDMQEEMIDDGFGGKNNVIKVYDYCYNFNLYDRHFRCRF